MEKNYIKHRNSNELIEIKEGRLTLFLYETFIGRIILKIITNKLVSKFVGFLLNTRLSTLFINVFIKKNDIDMSNYKKIKYKSFNEFFRRQIIEEKRVIGSNLISPCDSKLSVYKIDKNNTFKIKNTIFNINTLLSDKISKEYIGGDLLVFRLGVDDYHRYSYIDDGDKTKNYYISGRFHTVRPVSLSKFKIYHENAREWTVLNTKNFGKVIQIEVGALMVGKIKNYHQEYKFKRGEEKGNYMFGI